MNLTKLEQATLMMAQALITKDTGMNQYEIASKAREIALEVLRVSAPDDDMMGYSPEDNADMMSGTGSSDDMMESIGDIGLEDIVVDD